VAVGVVGLASSSSSSSSSSHGVDVECELVCGDVCACCGVGSVEVDSV
jgi:hypothetical protein